jgi:hypothetical protein
MIFDIYIFFSELRIRYLRIRLHLELPVSSRQKQ